MQAGGGSRPGQAEDPSCDADPNNSSASERELWSADSQPFTVVPGAEEPLYATSIHVTWGHQGQECDLVGWLSVAEAIPEGTDRSRGLWPSVLPAAGWMRPLLKRVLGCVSQGSSQHLLKTLFMSPLPCFQASE